MNAARGVLVPTSWVGQASRDFAARNNNRIQTSKAADSNTSSRERIGIEALVSLPSTTAALRYM
jgi:restriction system protein